MGQKMAEEVQRAYDRHRRAFWWQYDLLVRCTVAILAPVLLAVLMGGYSSAIGILVLLVGVPFWGVCVYDVVRQYLHWRSAMVGRRFRGHGLDAHGERTGGGAARSHEALSAVHGGLWVYGRATITRPAWRKAFMTQGLDSYCVWHRVGIHSTRIPIPARAAPRQSLPEAAPARW